MKHTNLDTHNEKTFRHELSNIHKNEWAWKL